MFFKGIGRLRHLFGKFANNRPVAVIHRLRLKNTVISARCAPNGEAAHLVKGYHEVLLESAALGVGIISDIRKIGEYKS